MTLKQYMPAYYDGVREMNELLNIEDSLFSRYLTEFDKVKANQFIMTADLDGIEVYERILGITATTGESLDFRRSRALNRWVDITPYTHNALYSKIARLQGNENFRIVYDHRQFKITVITSLTIFGQVGELIKMLDYMVPTNLIKTHINNISYESTGYLYQVQNAAYVSTYQTTHDFEAKYESEANMNTGVSYQSWAEMTTTHDFEAEYETIGSTNAGVSTQIWKEMVIE